MEDLIPEETVLVGMWLDLGSKVVGDAIYDRIEWLVGNRLELVKADRDGLLRLFRDPADGRLWEYSRQFVGAPPMLKAVSEEEAARI